MIFDVIIPVFLVIILSFIFGKIKKINLGPLVNISVYLTVPALVFSSIVQNEFIFSDFVHLFLSAAAVILGAGLVVYLVFKAKKFKQRGMYLPVMFMNTANIGFPVALFAFGDAGLSRAILYSATCSLIIFSLGVYIAAKKTHIQEIFRLPLIYAVVLGILFAVYKIPVPGAILKPITLLGQAAIPLQLIILGVRLSSVRIHHYKTAIIAAVSRFGLGFLISLGFVILLGVTGITRNIIILQSTMPAALFCIILSEKYKRDQHIVASTVFISTVLAIITIPLILKFLSLW